MALSCVRSHRRPERKAIAGREWARLAANCLLPDGEFLIQ